MLLFPLLTFEGHINLHRTQDSSSGLHTIKDSPVPKLHQSKATNKDAAWRKSRPSPYHRGRGQTGLVRIGHRNRTLVLNNPAPNQYNTLEKIDSPTIQKVDSDTALPYDEHGPQPSQPGTGWVSKRDRHMQLINSNVYEKEVQKRNEAMRMTQSREINDKNQREKEQILQYFQTHSTRGGGLTVQSSNIATTDRHTISINGSEYRVVQGGSKLARVSG